MLWLWGTTVIIINCSPPPSFRASHVCVGVLLVRRASTIYTSVHPKPLLSIIPTYMNICSVRWVPAAVSWCLSACVWSNTTNNQNVLHFHARPTRRLALRVFSLPLFYAFDQTRPRKRDGESILNDRPTRYAAASRPWARFACVSRSLVLLLAKCDDDDGGTQILICALLFSLRNCVVDSSSPWFSVSVCVGGWCCLLLSPRVLQ